MREKKQAQRLSVRQLSLIVRYAIEPTESNDPNARKWPRGVVRAREERDREFAEIAAVAESESDR